MNKTNLAKNLKYLRKLWGLNKEVLASNLNVETKFIVSLENGHEFFSMKTLTDICNFFQVTTDQLLNYDLTNDLETSLYLVEGRVMHIQYEVERFVRFNFTDEDIYTASAEKVRDLAIWQRNLLRDVLPVLQECLRITKIAISKNGNK